MQHLKMSLIILSLAVLSACGSGNDSPTGDICKPPQIWNADKKACVDPADMCIPPQVWDAEKRLCVTPPPPPPSPDISTTFTPVPHGGLTFGFEAIPCRGCTIISYGWDFGDGTKGLSDLPFIEHTYTLEGIYTVILTTTDSNGQTGGQSQELTAPARLDTGITNSQCYKAGSNALVSCADPLAIALNDKQDGMLITPLSYSQVGGSPLTSCVKDNNTGLIWEGKEASGTRAGGNVYTNFDNPNAAQKFNGSSYVYPTQAEIDAASNTVGYMNYVNSISLCGYTDWRLPTADELQGIVDYSVPAPNAMVQSAWFPNASKNSTWSVTPLYGNVIHVWSVSFSDGSVGGYKRYDSTVVVRLVRGTGYNPSVRFNTAADPDGTPTVIDNKTGLTWKRCAEGQTWSGSTCTGSVSQLKHEAALILAKTAATNSGKAWRLPNIKELASIADRGLVSPAIDTTVFPAASMDWYWSATPHANDPSLVMNLNANIGGVYTSGTRSNSVSAARLVRSSP